MKKVRNLLYIFKIFSKNLVSRNLRKLQAHGISTKFYRTERWVLSRTACLGNDSLELVQPIKQLKIPRSNLQKNRVDHLNFQLKGGIAKTARSEEIVGEAIFKMVQKQGRIPNFKYARPLFILIDTFSELTDQKFTTHDGRVFYANYTDVNPRFIQNGEILASGRIASSEILGNYTEMCRRLDTIWPDVTIIFLAYPTYYESRSDLLAQSAAIRSAIYSVAEDRLKTKIIEVPVETVKQDIKTDDYPYHFGNKTKMHIAQEIITFVSKLQSNHRLNTD